MCNEDEIEYMNDEFIYDNEQPQPSSLELEDAEGVSARSG